MTSVPDQIRPREFALAPLTGNSQTKSSETVCDQVPLCARAE